MSAFRRSLRLLAAAAAAIAVTALTLAPRALVAPARETFMQLVRPVMVPLLGGISAAEAERILNTLMFVPLGAAIALLLGRRAWLLAILAGFVLSATVEYAQLSIPGRVPDRDDVLWNTVGAAIGVIAVTAPRIVLAARARAAQRGSATLT